MKLWLQNFFKKHGAMFVGLYIVSFFIISTFLSKSAFRDLPKNLGTSLASAIFFIIIFEVYKGLKS